MGMNASTILFPNVETLEVYPAAQSQCAQVKVPGERYRRTVADMSYNDGVWRRYTGTREAGEPLTDAELAAIAAAPRVCLCG